MVVGLYVVGVLPAISARYTQYFTRREPAARLDTYAEIKFDRSHTVTCIHKLAYSISMVGKTERPCLRQLELLDSGVPHARGPVLVEVGQHHHGSSVAVREVAHNVADHNGRREAVTEGRVTLPWGCLLYTSPSPRDATLSRMPSSA